MSGNPISTSRETATYGGWVVAFRMPVSYNVLRDIERAALLEFSDPRLPAPLCGLIRQLASYKVIVAAQFCNADLLLRLAQVNPTNRTQMSAYDAFDLFAGAFGHITNNEITWQDWKSLPATLYWRGEGFLLGVTGVQLATILDQYCTPRN